MAVETELKLSLPAGAVTGLRRHPLLASLQPLRQHLVNCYYDTPGLDLLRAGLAVRHRRTAWGWLLTVKSAEPAAGGLARRSEWEAPSQPGVFDFSHVDDKRLRRRLTALQPALQAAFFTDFLRTTWLLEPAPGVRIELALDRGEIRHDERRATICEIELELLEGPVAALFEVALALQAGLPLRPEVASKAERGYRLFGDAPACPVRAAGSPLTDGMSPVAAFRAMAFACLEHLLRNEAGAALGKDPEYLHQARIAVRRLRSAMRFWAPVLPAAFVASQGPAWRDFGRRLGDARNLDVFIEQTMPPLLARFPGHRDLTALLASAGRRRQAARRHLRTAFSASVSGRLTLEFAAALHALPEVPATIAGSPPPTLDDFAARRLRRLVRATGRIAAGLATAPETHHRLRIAIKRLRYALEFVAPLLRRRPLRRYLARASAVQESLGQLNDLHFAETLLAGQRSLADSELPHGWLAGRAALLHERLPALLTGFLGLRKPWRRRRRR